MPIPHTRMPTTLAAGSAPALVMSGPVVNGSDLNAPNTRVTVTGSANSSYGLTALRATVDTVAPTHKPTADKTEAARPGRFELP